MIILDLDGTLLNSNGKVSEITKSGLMELKKNGFIIVIATGRIYASAVDATDGALFANYIISDTGSCVFDISNDVPVFSNYIESNVAEQILEYYNDDCLFIDICNKNTIYKFTDEAEENPIIINTMDKNYIVNSCKMISHISISMKDNASVMKVYDDLKLRFNDLEIIVMQDSFSLRKWIEIMPKGSSKYNCIVNLSSYLGISNDEVIAFGDGLNDIEMLEKCGVGIALKNALPEVKNVADGVTDYDHNNNGVINYLREHLYN